MRSANPGSAVSMSIVRNEADIIETMVRHNRQFLDKMYFIDNGSVDGTQEILLALADEGLPVEMRIDTTPGHPQRQLVTQFANSAEASNAFLFLLDGDELIAADLGVFRDYLAQAESSFHIGWQTYVPLPGDDLNQPLVTHRFAHHRIGEGGRFGHKVVISPRHPRPLQVKNGSHNIGGMELRAAEAIKLAHFPVRDPQQISIKGLLGAWNVQLRGREGREAWQWFEVADQVRRQGALNEEAFFRIGAHYGYRKPKPLAKNPLRSPQPINLRYSHLRRDPLLAGVIQFADQLVAQWRAKPAQA